jgi:hypothetical protein
MIFPPKTLLSISRKSLTPSPSNLAAVTRAQNCCVRLAVECKNIGVNFPLLISCIPRHADESFHEVAIVGEIEDGQEQFGMYSSRAHVIRLSEENSLYPLGSPHKQHLIAR